MSDEATFLNFGAGQQSDHPEDMARLLQAACPEQAAGFAAAAHERACTMRNGCRAEFWGTVASILARRARVAPRRLFDMTDA